MIAVASGANSGLLPEDVEAAEHLIGDSRVVVLQLEIPLDVVQCAAQLGVRAGCTVILNPAPAQPLEREMLCSISILTPNEKETASLTGIEPKDDVTSRAAAQKLRASGVDSVVITMGKKGAYLLSEKDEGLIQAPKVQPKDTTAAGDAFNGALAHAIARGVDLPAAIDFANHAAALSVTRLGAQPSLPTLEEISKEFPALSVF
jgi:ribokinase